MLSSRFLKTSVIVAAAVAFTCGSLATSSAFAEAPMAKTQAPGFYRMMLGDFEVTALSDGTVKLPMKDLLLKTTPAKIDAALKRAHIRAPLKIAAKQVELGLG